MSSEFGLRLQLFGTGITRPNVPGFKPDYVQRRQFMQSNVYVRRIRDINGYRLRFELLTMGLIRGSDT